MREACFTFSAFLRDKAGHLMALALATGLVSFAMNMARAQLPAIIFAAALTAAILTAPLVLEYLKKRSFYRSLHAALQNLEKTRYFPEFLDEARFAEGRAAYRALKEISRLSSQEILALEQEAKDYRTYVDLWIHEVKTPLAAAKLIASRLRGPDAFAMKQELERIEMQVENALYYARSTSLSHDYRIRSVFVSELVQERARKTPASWWRREPG